MKRKMLSARDREIIRRAVAGEARAQTAAALGADLSEVYEVLTQARKRGVDIPRVTGTGRPKGSKWIAVDEDTAQRLVPAAEARGITATEIGARLIAVCAKEPVLIDNILEDLE